MKGCEHSWKRARCSKTTAPATRVFTKTPYIYYCNYWHCSPNRISFLPEEIIIHLCFVYFIWEYTCMLYLYLNIIEIVITSSILTAPPKIWFSSVPPFDLQHLFATSNSTWTSNYIINLSNFTWQFFICYYISFLNNGFTSLLIWEQAQLPKYILFKMAGQDSLFQHIYFF